MATTAPRPLAVAYIDPWTELWESFELHLAGEGRSKHTVRIYKLAVRQFREFLERSGRPTDPREVRKADVQAFVAELLETRAQATARANFGGLRSWFSWMEAEGEVERSPMTRMHAPVVNERPTPVLSVEELGRLFKACSGPGFEDRRDAALFRLFVDTGLRRQEMARLAVEDLDLQQGLLVTKVKGGATHLVPFGSKAARDLDRYLRARSRHRLAGLTVEREPDQGGLDKELVHPLWLSAQGGLTDDGIYAVLRRRAALGGLDPKKVHPHMFRHTFADSLKRGGASDEDVQRLGRWRDSKMVRRYGAALSQQRAFETHRRLSPGDRL